MATVDSVQRRLWARAQLRAADFGFAPFCETLVKDLTTDSANTLANEGYLSDPERLSIAEQNIDRFIKEMIDEARRKGYDQLHEDTYHFARARLCPLWPLC
jgi:hypothetical protein